MKLASRLFRQVPHQEVACCASRCEAAVWSRIQLHEDLGCLLMQRENCLLACCWPTAPSDSPFAFLGASTCALCMVSLPMAGGLELGDLHGPFQPKPCYDSVNWGIHHLSFITNVSFMDFFQCWILTSRSLPVPFHLTPWITSIVYMNPSRRCKDVQALKNRLDHVLLDPWLEFGSTVLPPVLQ